MLHLSALLQLLALVPKENQLQIAIFFKNIFIECSAHLFDDFIYKKKIIERTKELPLSGRTVQRCGLINSRCCEKI